MRIDPCFLLVAGFILKRDDGQFCKKCGLIGHSHSQFHMVLMDVEELHRDQAHHTRSRYPTNFSLDITKVIYIDDIRAFRCHPSRRTNWVKYKAKSKPSPIDLLNNQQPGVPQPLNNQHQTNRHSQPKNQPLQNNNEPYLGENIRNHFQSQRTTIGPASFDRFMVRDLSDLDTQNP